MAAKSGKMATASSVCNLNGSSRRRTLPLSPPPPPSRFLLHHHRRSTATTPSLVSSSLSDFYGTLRLTSNLSILQPQRRTRRRNFSISAAAAAEGLSLSLSTWCIPLSVCLGCDVYYFDLCSCL